MNKLLTIVLAAGLLSGCGIGMKTVKGVSNEVCMTGEERRMELRAKLDEVTHPHIVRIQCNAQ